ncbi:DUF3375 domain-containing protein [Sediminibacterium ginsengisoli]|uniref:TIGR02677 family protein n=1 Tax=Sediminibacterium ginsengisoli TaxID=413434 RepID=A0A1T4P0U8_9BACT|nr:DUF3375 domain-containing protein [Sediminibacterium ginsengisoli]SJZ84937.1 Protein of unknown function [Sediminibacterium ginsengisoli]
MLTEDFSLLFETSPAIQFIRLRNAKWVMPFLYKVFQSDNTRFSVPESQLLQWLTETLLNQENGQEDLEEAQILLGETEEVKSRKYLQNWVQRRILQDFTDDHGNTMYQLSSYSVKVFQWIQSLQLSKHVGTESRFKLVFNSLRDILENTEDDKNKRLETLKNKRAEIDKEIKALELGINPENYSNAQIEERLDLFTRHCYELIGDFREVEDNFKQIHRSIVEQHTKAELNKGKILGFAFEAYDTLRNSNQGKSFYAFWDFLISRAGQEEWRELTIRLLDLLSDRSIEADQYFIENIKSLLLSQGKNVYESNDKMAEKLSKIITEKEITRHRRLRTQINNIKELAFDLIDEDKIPAGIELTDRADIRLHMEKKLNLQQKDTQVVLKQPMEKSEKIEDMERFSRLINKTHVNKKALWQKVENLLKQKETATLSEVLDATPLEHGIAEVVTYYDFLKEKSKQVQIIKGTTEIISINPDRTKFIEVPYLLFGKQTV